MAAASPASPLPVTSRDTALCIVPPKHLWPSVERLRANYDQAYEKWPPHVNLIYPFVRPEVLPEAAGRISSFLQHQPSDPLRVCLDNTGAFRRKHDNVIYRHDGSRQNCAKVAKLRE